MTERLSKDWSVEPLRKVAEVVSGGTPSRYVPEFWNGGRIPWVTPTDLTKTTSRFLTETKDYITESGLQSCSAKLLPAGALLMSSRATVGEIRIAVKEVCTNQGFKSLVPLNGTNGEFLYYQMLRSRERYRSLGIGSTFLEVNKRDTERFEILVAPLPQQKRIAEILSTIDEAIEQTEALIAKTQQVKAGLMHDLFTRGVTKDGHLRPLREEAPQIYKQSPLGWIPREWESRPLRSITSYQHGRPFPSSEYGDEGVLLLRPGNLHSSGFVLFDEAHTTRLPLNWLSDAPSYVLRPGDIVMNLTAQSLEDKFLGRVCLNEESECALLNQRIARFTSIGISSVFLYWLLRSHQFRVQIDKTTQGTKVQHLYNRDLDRVVFHIPANREEQKSVADRLFAVTNEIRHEEASLGKLKSLKAGLMHDLLTGRVQVEVKQSGETTA